MTESIKVRRGFSDPFARTPEALLDAPVCDRAVRLWSMLDRYAGQDGVAYPSRRTLAGRLRCSLDSLDRAVADLVVWGWLEVERRVNATSLYTLLHPELAFEGSRTGAAGVAAGMRPGSRTGAAGGGRTRAAQNESQVEREPLKDTVGRREADRLCAMLADHAERMTDRRPRITERWVTAARLLIDSDGQSPEAVERAIRWVAADAFWSTVVLSMPKLREKWPTLVAQARRRGASTSSVEDANASLREWAEQGVAA